MSSLSISRGVRCTATLCLRARAKVKLHGIATPLHDCGSNECFTRFCQAGRHRRGVSAVRAFGEMSSNPGLVKRRRRACQGWPGACFPSGNSEGAGDMNVAAVARRVLAEFEEMPGMALTYRQASRLFG